MEPLKLALESKVRTMVKSLRDDHGINAKYTVASDAIRIDYMIGATRGAHFIRVAQMRVNTQHELQMIKNAILNAKDQISLNIC